MADEQNSPAKRVPTKEQTEVQEEAKRLAQQQGVNWKDLPKEKRQELKRLVRQKSSQKQA